MEKVTHMRKVKAVLVVSLLGFAAASCSGGGPAEREYAVPDTLCGLSVEQDLYTDLFPPGKELDLQKVEQGELWWTLCTVRVDEEPAFAIKVTAAAGDRDLAAFLSYHYETGDGEVVRGDYEMGTWPHAAVARGTCDNRGAETSYNQDSYSHAVILETFYPEDDEESAAIVRGLIGPLVEADRERLGCR